MNHTSRKSEKSKNEEKIIEQVQRLLEERSRRALEIAKREILEEKMECRELNAAFTYYAKDWKDVIHPGLVSIACEAVGGNVENAIPVQVVMLLLTAGIDVHDDVIDESKAKYGNPTILAKFGKDATILAGDVLLMKAMFLLHQLQKELSGKTVDLIWNVIADHFFELGDAEALESSLADNVGVSAEECFRILRMKAATFEAHARIGAITGGGNQDVVDSLGEYGRTLGILLHIREDFIDMFEPRELQDRFSNECLPLPILYAFKDPQTKKTIVDSLSKKEISNEDAERIVQMIYANTNVEMLRTEIDHLAQKAYKVISKIPDKSVSSSMEKLIRGIIEDL